MGKTLVIFGLNNTLLEINERAHSRAPEALIKPKKDVRSLLEELRKLKEQNEGIDFYILTNFSSSFIEAFLEKTSSQDIFNQDIVLCFEENSITESIYHNIWHKLLKHKSKRVFEIKGYDKIILVDNLKKQRCDFRSLKRKILFRRKPEFLEYKKRLWGYIYGKSCKVVLKELPMMLMATKGIIIK